MKYLVALLILTNPVQAGFDDLWASRVAKEPDQIGVASIYHDRRVATGERFDGKALTCAHRTRPSLYDRSGPRGDMSKSLLCDGQARG
jgi:hypothetical protein